MLQAQGQANAKSNRYEYCKDDGDDRRYKFPFLGPEYVLRPRRRLINQIGLRFVGADLRLLNFVMWLAY